MASANEPGVLKIFAESPEGQRFLTHRYRSDSPINAGKSPDGVLANLTIDKWQFVPEYTGVTLTGGWKVILNFTLDAADGIDASDCVINLPLTIRGGGVRQLNATDLGFTTDLPASTVAAQPIDLGTGYTIPNGQSCHIGGGAGVISIEDDT